ncbi:tellurite resistance TerB family protein [Microscilla marina]|uniref:TerB family tellurite resistance protein n=1 Tax=Microscilla marina ATCC 23134 TaxID=313606 RepID=A1ZFQ0_MICM2|nr:TerB family tellurite resistance protein [Microscilla marina]EAY30824.1 hypothetical protein M23134_01148 [Microscilla marina ATCC 23134]
MLESFKTIISLIAYVSLGFTFMEVYLTLNKLWKRRHDRKVAESISITGKFIGFFTSSVFVLNFSFAYHWQGAINASFWAFAAVVQIFIGAGLWVVGQQKAGFWTLVKRALKLERKEAGDLAKSFFRPSQAYKVIEILSKVAMIDEVLDDSEKEFIQQFAELWDIHFDWEEFTKENGQHSPISFTELRNAMVEYLHTSPPTDQVSQLGDVLNMLVRIDGVVSEEEELVLEELMGLIKQYEDEDPSTVLYSIAIVPQSAEQEQAILQTMPTLRKSQVAGGHAFLIGPFHSQKYAQIVCNKYRMLRCFSVVVEMEDSLDLSQSTLPDHS